MREYIEPTPGVEDMTDSVEKILPALAAGARAVMASPTGRKVVAQGAMMGADAIRQKLESKKQEVAAAEQELQQA